MIILGIGGILGDAASALLNDGELAAAVEESKLTRHKNTGDLPQESIRTCLSLAGVKTALTVERGMSVAMEIHPNG